MDPIKEVPCIHCLKKKKPDPKCKSCKGTGKLKLEFASTTGLDYLSLFRDRILDALEEAAGVPILYISDESSISDFPDEMDLKKLSDALGVPVKRNDLLIDIAKRMKDA